MGQYLGGSDPAGAKAATEAMLQMRKIDLEAIRVAYENAAS
jgi:predicted 3-demethylubiquinone-9 3-methyltransferase (glyoxalase superfamily)